ncbi:MAG: FkbM family methyltransferase [Chitinispirillales bacterium]|jgi:FkbM family methyltransferase|nr:FkbM family methyltransferase [Chitinispirillales bacterium]
MKKTFTDNYLPKFGAKSIYEHMQDDESRKIFMWRYDYFVTRDNDKFNNAFFQNIKRDYKFNFLINDLKNYKGDVILYGAGAICETLIPHLLKYSEIKIKTICDTYKSGTTICGIPIITVDEMLATRCDSPIVLSTLSGCAQNEMREVLLSHGVKKESIFVPLFPQDKEQYFVADIIKPKNNEVFIDAGGFDGDTILCFADFVKNSGYKRIYSFEPDPEYYEKAKSTIENYHLQNVLLFNKGLWNKSETLNFDLPGVAGSSIVSEGGKIKIEAVALDDVVDKSDKVTFIKMDIEGAELNALHGSKEIIKRDKPRLAICVYHKPKDILYLASYILELNPEYKFYLRHHSPISLFETVLYAI